jgi:uncharacterized membrane protein YhhN
VTAALALSLLCLVAVVGLLFAEWRNKAIARAVLKMCASTSFVLVALLLGALESTYGRFLLAALALGWLGDALLLSTRSGSFLAGLGVFLLSHVCFALAFVTGSFSATGFVLALLPALAVGVGITRWLWPHLPGRFKAPVAAYIVTILLMCAAAAGFAAASAIWSVLVGAVLFAASDISVARDRFVERSFANKAWGWPIYFLAQLTLAWSVAASR